MKKLIFIFTALLVLVSLVACDKDMSDKEKVVNLYTDSHTAADQDLYDKFQEETGIEVKVILVDADELVSRLEKADDADLVMASNASSLYQAQTADLLKAYESTTIDNQVPSHLRQDDKSWTAITSNPRAIAYNRFRFDASTLSSYLALTGEEASNTIILGSADDINNQTLVASMVKLEGPEATSQAIEGLMGNLSDQVVENDFDQMAAVVGGFADLTLVNANSLGQMLNSEEKYQRNLAGEVGLFFPNQENSGTHLTISGAGLAKAASHTKNAVKLLEFLTGEVAQEAYTVSQYEYPVNPNVEPSELLQSWGDFKAQDINIQTVGELKEDALQLMNAAGWE